MKRIITTMVIAIMTLALCSTSNAQSVKDLLNKVTTDSKVTDIVESLTGMVITPKDITGTWNYTGAAVKLESEDIVKSAAASVAEHRAIYEAIASNNGKLASKLIIEHLNNAYNNMIKKEN